MKVALLVVGLDDQHRVTAVRVLRPGRIVTMVRARHVLELPMDREPPPHGSVLTWVDAGYRSIDPMRNPDRQPE